MKNQYTYTPKMKMDRWVIDPVKIALTIASIAFFLTGKISGQMLTLFLLTACSLTIKIPRKKKPVVGVDEVDLKISLTQSELEDAIKSYLRDTVTALDTSGEIEIVSFNPDDVWNYITIKVVGVDD